MPPLPRSHSIDFRSGLPVERRTSWVGATLVGGLILLAVWRELFAPGAGSLRFVRAAVRASEIVLDMAFLSALWRLVGPRAKTLLYGAMVAGPLNTLACAGFAMEARAVLDRLGLHDIMRSTAWGALRDGAIASLYLSGLWVLAFRYPDLVRASQQRASRRLTCANRQLVQLRAHLQPHFIRNTLNAVAALSASSRVRLDGCSRRWVIS